MNQQTFKRIKSENLDTEFKKILCVIREQIPYINSNAYLMQCRIWLEKLSSPNVNKILRNIYLTELCAQIQKNKLLPPFNEAPPSGSLKSLTKIWNRKSSRMLFQGCEYRKNKVTNLRKGAHEGTDINDFSTHPTLLSPNNSKLLNHEEFLTLERAATNDCMPTQRFKLEKHLPVRIIKSAVKLDFKNVHTSPNNTYEVEETTKNIQSENDLQNCSTNESIEIAIDNDSWSDVSSSAVDIASHYEEKVLNTTKFMENNDENKIVTDSVKSALVINDCESEGQVLKCYNDGDEDLNFKIPKDPHYLSEDWKNTIEALQLRLSEITQQNKELKAIIQKLESQIEDIKIKHKEEIDQMVKTLENHQSREIAKLKEIHGDNIYQVEKSFQDNIETIERDYQEKNNKLIDNYTEKILEINKQKEGVVRTKDNDICKLTEIIQQQCMRITNEISNLQNQVSNCSCDKKLLLLKKCVSKMDKLFRRSEKEYIKQIDKLRQELEIKNTALEIQLKMQKAELITESSSERQEEFDKILNSLEIKYIKMLEMHETQMMEMKKQDDEKIQSLKELLSKHGIPYDDHDV